jgi:hypothetical protein
LYDYYCFADIDTYVEDEPPKKDEDMDEATQQTPI